MKDSEQKMADCNEWDYMGRLLDEMIEGKNRALYETVDDTRRQYVRKPCFVAVDYSIEDYACRGFIKNMSPQGMFIETRETFPVGRNLIMSFSSASYEKPVKITGKIVRRVSEGLGIKLQQTANENLRLMIESLSE